MGGAHVCVRPCVFVGGHWGQVVHFTFSALGLPFPPSRCDLHKARSTAFSATCFVLCVSFSLLQKERNANHTKKAKARVCRHLQTFADHINVLR